MVILAAAVGSSVLSGCSKIKKIEQDLELRSPVQQGSPFMVRWAKELDPVYSTGNFPIGTSSPFIFEDYLYMGNLRGEMVSYEIESGRVLWKVKENGPIQSPANKYGDTIYYGSKEGRLFARHYYSGKLKYSVDLGAPIESQPQFLRGRLIIHLRNHSIVVLDAKTGKVFWRYKRSVPFSTTLQRVSAVQAYQGSLLVGFADGYVALLSLEEGVIKWEQKISTGIKFVDVDVRPTSIGNYILAGSAAGPMRLLNPSNGVIEKTIEITQSSLPLLEDDSFFVGGTDGTVHKVSNQGKILSSKKVSKDAISSIKKWKRGMVVTTMGSGVYYLDPVSLKILGKFDLGSDQSAIFGQAEVSEDGILAIYSSRNRLYVFR